MTTKIILLSIFTILIIILLLFLKCNSIEKFENSNEKYSSQNLVNMFNSLEVAEQRCSEIDERNKLKEEKEKIEYNESTFHELEELDKKILELKNIIKLLNSKEANQNNKNKKCRKDKELHLNKNYEFIKKLDTEKMVKKNNVNFDLNISDSLKKNFTNMNLPKSKCDIKNSKDYINIDKNKLSDKCYNCDGNKLKQNLPHIYNSFN
tara:strand:+ start:44 stop:664 length:621 start_codon:yes stop_codon:yes gene_type:complete